MTASRERPHGARARYTYGPTGSDPANGCRCIPCTDANRDYQRDRDRSRRSGHHRMVPAVDARRHLTWLATEGIGLRAVAATTGMDRTNLARIRDGHKDRILATTSDRILAVYRRRAARGGQLVDPAPTRALVADLLTRGWTRAALARELGYAGRGLQFLASPQIRRRRADQVAALHAHHTRPGIHRARAQAA